MMAAAVPSPRAYIIEVTRRTGPFVQQVAKVQGLFSCVTDAAAHGMELADNNGKVVVYPLVEVTFDEGRWAYKGGRQLHLAATNAARDGYAWERLESAARATAPAERAQARAMYGDSPFFMGGA
jgi:hypothetical protein